MTKKNFLSTILIVGSHFVTTSFVNAQAFVDVESGAVFTGYNNVRVAGNTGTLFSLKRDFNSQANVFIRARIGYTFKQKHTISILYAPLKVQSSGLTNKPIYFDGVNFPSNTFLNTSYKFNSYRITYRYDLVKKQKIEFGIGFTAKIRDAEIAIKSQALSASKKNVGFVPIINFRLNWKMNDKIGFLFEGDALAAPQGRAEDVILAATYNLSKKCLVRLGYRILEGGARNDEVYNFALFHYASFGITFNFYNNKNNIK